MLEQPEKKHCPEGACRIARARIRLSSHGVRFQTQTTKFNGIS